MAAAKRDAPRNCFDGASTWITSLAGARTVFLYGRTNGPDFAKTPEHEMREFRGVLHALLGARAEAISARHVVEDRLRKVMARTEGVASTIVRDSIVSEPPMAITILSTDLRQSAAVSDLALAADAPEITEYLQDGLICENWVPIDILDILMQMRIYILDRLQHLRGNPARDL